MSTSSEQSKAADQSASATTISTHHPRPKNGWASLTQPGHWVLVLALLHLLFGGLWLAWESFASRPSSTTTWLFQGLEAVVAVLLAYGMLRQCQQGGQTGNQPWGSAWGRFAKFYLAGACVWLVYQLVGSDAFFLMTNGDYSSPALNGLFAVMQAMGRYVIPAGWLLAAVVAVVHDLRQPIRRDWLHWLGVGFLAVLLWK